MNTCEQQGKVQIAQLNGVHASCERVWCASKVNAPPTGINGSGMETAAEEKPQ